MRSLQTWQGITVLIILLSCLFITGFNKLIIAKPAAQTVTPSPTLDVQQRDKLRKRWIGNIESAIGFTHSVFESRVDTLIVYVAALQAEITRSDPHPQIARTQFDGDIYTVVLLPDFALYIGDSPLIFRMLHGVPHFIPFPVRKQFFCCVLYFDAAYSITDNVFAFGDINGNHYPDIAIHADSGGSGGYGSFALLEVRSGGQIVDITPVTAKDVTLHNFIDMNGDGIFEIEGFGAPSPPIGKCCDPAKVHYYQWNGSEYQENNNHDTPIIR